MKADQKNYACVADCGKINPGSKAVVKNNDNHVVLDLFNYKQKKKRDDKNINLPIRISNIISLGEVVHNKPLEPIQHSPINVKPNVGVLHAHSYILVQVRNDKNKSDVNALIHKVVTRNFGKQLPKVKDDLKLDLLEPKEVTRAENLKDLIVNFFKTMSDSPNYRSRTYISLYVDNFENVEISQPSAFFLSHCHTDHMQGLHSKSLLNYLISNNVHIYTTELSAAIINHEKTDNRIMDYVKVLRLGSSLISLPSAKGPTLLTVTLIPAGHSVGAVMFLFRTINKSILFTGDFRINPNDIQSYAGFHESEKPIQINTMYIDTTFIHSAYERFPKRSESIELMIKEVDANLSMGRGVALHTSAKYGYEFVFNEIYKRLGLKVYVNEERWRFYRTIQHLVPSVTNNQRETKIHLCTKRNEKNHSTCIPNTYPHFLYVHLSAMKWTYYNVKPVDRVSPTRLDVCFATHCSRWELLSFVDYFKPDRVLGFPNAFENGLKRTIDSETKKVRVDRKLDKKRADTHSQNPNYIRDRLGNEIWKPMMNESWTSRFKQPFNPAWMDWCDPYHCNDYHKIVCGLNRRTDRFRWFQSGCHLVLSNLCSTYRGSLKYDIVDNKYCSMYVMFLRLGCPSVCPSKVDPTCGVSLLDNHVVLFQNRCAFERRNCEGGVVEGKDECSQSRKSTLPLHDRIKALRNRLKDEIKQQIFENEDINDRFSFANENYDFIEQNGADGAKITPIMDAKLRKRRKKKSGNVTFGAQTERMTGNVTDKPEISKKHRLLRSKIKKKRAKQPLDIFYRREFKDELVHEPLPWAHCHFIIMPYLMGIKTEITTNKDKQHNFRTLKHSIQALFAEWKLDISNASSLLKQTRVFRPPCVRVSDMDGSTQAPKVTLYPKKTQPTKCHKAYDDDEISGE
ncbi:unnamed protein product [Leptosia nina]|uniref:Protein artemis n=1 Tax=Leptosia nina TaxID=320188 RepID=A0AAV1JUS5_9NEOP